MPGSALDEIRAATRHLHARLEDAVGVTRRGLTTDGYRDYLARLWGWHAPLEEALRAAPTVPRWRTDALARAQLLERDLRELGWGADELCAAPRCGALPDLSSAGRVLGVAYVVEGAALGGAAVHRVVAAALPGAAARAAGFLRPHGDAAAARERWRAFVAALEADAPALGLGEVVAGAVDAFATLHAWFSREGARGR